MILCCPLPEQLRRPSKALTFQELPTELRFSIYTNVFHDICLSPTGSSSVVPPQSRLGLLRLCKSEKALIEQALWKCATVTLDTSIKMAILVLRRTSTEHIRSIRLDAASSSCEDPPSALVSKVLRLLPNLELVEVLGYDPSWIPFLRLKHTTLLAEIQDATSELRSCIEYVLSDLMHPQAFQPFVSGRVIGWQKRPVVTACFDITSRGPDSVELGLPVSGNLELEDFTIQATFRSDTWAVTLTHDQQSFVIPQVSFLDIANRMYGYEDGYEHYLTVSHEDAENGVWAIKNEFFSDLPLNPVSAVMLHRFMYCAFGSPTERAWMIGAALLFDYPGNVVTCIPEMLQDLNDDSRWEVWRRLSGNKTSDVGARAGRLSFEVQQLGEKPDAVDAQFDVDEHKSRGKWKQAYRQVQGASMTWGTELAFFESLFGAARVRQVWSSDEEFDVHLNAVQMCNWLLFGETLRGEATKQHTG